MSTSAIRVFLFKGSYEPFTVLLQEREIKFNASMPPVGVPTASGLTIEILKELQSPVFCTALAAVIREFLKNRRSRKVIITTHDNTVIHAEGLSQSELERVIARTKNMSAIESARDEAAPAGCETADRRTPPWK